MQKQEKWRIEALSDDEDDDDDDIASGNQRHRFKHVLAWLGVQGMSGLLSRGLSKLLASSVEVDCTTVHIAAQRPSMEDEWLTLLH